MMTNDPKSMAQMAGVDPAKIEQAKLIGRHIKAVVRQSPTKIEITFNSENPEISQAIPQLSSQLAGNIMDFLYNYLGISGERINLR